MFLSVLFFAVVKDLVNDCFRTFKSKNVSDQNKSCPEVYSHQWRLNFAKAIGSLLKTPGSKGKVVYSHSLLLNSPTIR